MEEIEEDIQVPIIKHKVPVIGYRVLWWASPHKNIIIKLIIGIHLKLSVTHVVILGSTKMVVLFEVMTKLKL